MDLEALLANVVEALIKLITTIKQMEKYDVFICKSMLNVSFASTPIFYISVQ